MKGQLEISRTPTRRETQSVTTDRALPDLVTGSKSSSFHKNDGEPKPSGDNRDAPPGDRLAEKAEYPTLWKTVAIILGLFLGVFLVALDQTIIGTAIPKITNEFKTIQVRSRHPIGHHSSGCCATVTWWFRHRSPGEV